MSMLAKFVEVAPDRFAEILEEPDSVTNLFTEQTAGGLDLIGRLAKAAARLDPATADRITKDAPGMLADAIERMQNPAIREALAKRLGELGIRTPELRSGTQGQNVMKLMQERMAALQAKFGGGGGAGGGAGASPKSAPTQISLDKAWHGVHYLLCGRAEP